MIVPTTEGSPIVPAESQILEIPVFPNGAPTMNFAMNQLTVRPLRKSSLYSYSQSLTESDEKLTCKCPHILVSDDDPFQNFYYETLFQRSISWEEILGNKENFRFELFSSGEELVKRFKKIKACGCDKTVLVISDYNMGENKMNGVETIKAIRKYGYEGATVLRTSEEKEYLEKRHVDLGKMLEKKVVDCYVEKNDLKKAKEVIQTLVRNMKN